MLDGIGLKQWKRLTDIPVLHSLLHPQHNSLKLCKNCCLEHDLLMHNWTQLYGSVSLVLNFTTCSGQTHGSPSIPVAMSLLLLSRGNTSLASFEKITAPTCTASCTHKWWSTDWTRSQQQGSIHVRAYIYYFTMCASKVSLILIVCRSWWKCDVIFSCLV